MASFPQAVLARVLEPAAEGARQEMQGRSLSRAQSKQQAAQRVAQGGKAHVAAPDVRRTPNWSEEKRIAAQRMAQEIRSRIHTLGELGLGYLSRERSTPTLSSGELQRLRLATAELGPAILDRVHDKRLQIPDSLTIVVTQLSEPDTRNAALGWLEANVDRLKPRFGVLLGALIPSDFCSEDAARRVDRLFRPRMADSGIGDLDLARPVAAIRQCAALKAARGAEVSAALARAK